MNLAVQQFGLTNTFDYNIIDEALLKIANTIESEEFEICNIIVETNVYDEVWNEEYKSENFYRVLRKKDEKAFYSLNESEQLSEMVILRREFCPPKDKRYYFSLIGSKWNSPYVNDFIQGLLKLNRNEQINLEEYNNLIDEIISKYSGPKYIRKSKNEITQ